MRPFTAGDWTCLDRQLPVDVPATTSPPPPAALRRFRTALSAASFAARAFGEFERMLAANRPVPDGRLSEPATYDRLGLRRGQRQAGLRQLDDGQLFALAALQAHCGRSEAGFERIKPFVEGRIAQRQM